MDFDLDIRRMTEEIVSGIEAEKRAMKQKLGALSELSDVDLRQGKLIVPEPGAYVYSFDCELEIALAEGVEVQIMAPGVTSVGEIWEHDTDQGKLRLVLRENIGRQPAEAVMSFDASFLLDLLKARIEQITERAQVQSAFRQPVITYEHNLDMALDLLLGRVRPGSPVRVSNPGVSEAQRASIEFAIGQRIAYLWGPPGTGKTRTVAHLVGELARRSERVFLCAHTNTATDNALLQAFEAVPWEPGSLVRIGHCSEPVLKAGISLDSLLDGILKQVHAEIAQDIKRLCRETARLHEDPPEALVYERAPLGRRIRIARDYVGGIGNGHLADLKRSIAEACKQVGDLEIELISNASVVATTLTRLYTNRLLGKLCCDTLVIDEAGAASLAICLAAASKVKKRVVAVGDFMQLPAIVQSDDKPARNWLGRSVFESAGCDQPDQEHPLRAMLYEQWRMHPGISRIISSMFYAEKLRDAPCVVERACSGPAVVVLDTNGSGSRSEPTRAGSKMNRSHSEIVARLVTCDPSSEIAVIAPYRAQARILREVIRVESQQALASGRVEVFTIHRFQGRDKQVVIFDLVEAPGTQCYFLDEHRNPAAGRLINVAMSRAKEKLILVANLDHLSRSLGREALINRVMAQVRLNGGLELEADREVDMARLTGFLQGEP